MNTRRRLWGALAAGLLLCGMPLPRAQGRVHRIGYLMPRATFGELDAAFVQGLQELGYVVGRNLAIEARWAANDLDKLPVLADALVRLQVDVLVTATTAGTRAAMGATRTIPIVFAAAADPVAAGLVASLGRPGGNVTGLSLQTTDAARKRLQLAQELVPGARRIGLLAERVSDPTRGTTALLVTETRAAAAALGIAMAVRELGPGDSLEEAFAWLEREHIDALVVQVSPLTLQWTDRIVALAARQRLPALYEARNFAAAGGLASYGPDLRASYRRAAAYVDRILKGARPGDLPVEQPDVMALVINLQAAQALGLAPAQSLLLRADELIR
ncbi:MAG TPA: ABC transporter substrate-binding protein [Rubrivivax sp.]|nr:ABC transporter substrate-binding protein [Rubrivivax sp.]